MLVPFSLSSVAKLRKKVVKTFMLIYHSKYTFVLIFWLKYLI